MQIEKGLSEVRWDGIGDKRQFILCVVIDVEKKLVLHLQIIWEGKEGLSGACPPDGFKTNMQSTSTTPRLQVIGQPKSQ